MSWSSRSTSRWVLAGAAVLSCFLEQPIDGADCNGNGVPDDQDLLPLNPALEPSAEIPASGPDEPHDIRFVDLDADGDLDFLGLFVARVAPAVEGVLNDGAGAFTPQLRIPLDDWPQAHATGDLDGDGDPDIAVCHADPPNVTVHVNSGSGSFLAWGEQRPPPRHRRPDLDLERALRLEQSVQVEVPPCRRLQRRRAEGHLGPDLRPLVPLPRRALPAAALPGLRHGGRDRLLRGRVDRLSVRASAGKREGLLGICSWSRLASSRTIPRVRKT